MNVHRDLSQNKCQDWSNFSLDTEKTRTTVEQSGEIVPSRNYEALGARPTVPSNYFSNWKVNEGCLQG